MFCSWFNGLLTCGLCSNDTVVDKLRVGLVGLVGWSGWVDLTGVASMASMTLVGRVVAAVSWVVDVEKSNTSVDVVVVGAVNSKGMGLAGNLSNLFSSHP